MLGLIFFGTPLAYTALSLYLLAKIQPIPIMFLPQLAEYRLKTQEPVTA